MSGFETLELTIADGRGTLTLARPDEGNAMTATFFREFGEAVQQLAVRAAELRVVVIRSTGRYFSVGGDIAGFAADTDAVPATILDGTRSVHPALARLARLDAPLVVAVQGPAAGGGLALLSHGDLVISSRSATFSAAYASIGFSPDMGSTVGLASRMGVARARRFLLLAERLDADAALAAGLVDEVVDDDALEGAVESRAAALAAGPTKAYGAIRRLLSTALAASFETQLEDEAQSLARTAGTEDAREGLAAFLEKRAPRFRGE
jgi:2-(1,2-epoxy-1,2-dihydrophenyl)acetyl-CoA isomerase